MNKPSDIPVFRSPIGLRGYRDFTNIVPIFNGIKKGMVRQETCYTRVR
jgi:hypothetical protein